jgi:hypothetical protein
MMSWFLEGGLVEQETGTRQAKATTTNDHMNA